MDTRTKILTPEALVALDAQRPVLVAIGRFDILRVEMARQLAEARHRTGARTLIAVVRPIAGAFAPLEARARMAAALRVIDYVFIAPNESPDGLLAGLQPIEILNLEEADAERVRQLTEHVRQRHA